MFAQSWRWLMLGLVAIVPLAGASDPSPMKEAPPPRTLPKSAALPPPNALKSELDGLANDRDEVRKDLPGDSTSAERAELRAQLNFLLKRINDAPPGTSYGKSPAPAPRPKFEMPPSGNVLDGMRLAQNLFRDDEIDAALRAFRLIDTAQMTREDRAFVQYMTATCLRKLNKPGEASIIYREVADAKEDEYLADCAVWQLSLLKSTQELEEQLEQLRSRSKSR